MQPIWEFRSKLLMGETSNHVAIKKKDGAERHGLTETLKRWEERRQEFFRKDQGRLKPRIGRISETEWNKEMMIIAPSIREIRQRASLTQIIKGEPDTEKWTNQSYTEQDIGREIRNLPEEKSMWMMGYQEKPTKQQDSGQ